MEIDLVLVRVVEFDLCDRAKTVLLKFIAERGKLLVGRHHRGLTFLPRGVLQAGGCPVRGLDPILVLDLPLQVDTLEARVVVEGLSSDFAKRTRSPGRVTARARVVCGNGGVDPPFPGACLLYTSPSPRDLSTSRMPSSA